MNNEKISIIVPVYNVEQYLKRCVHSLISQTYGNLEIILVDDGSTDRCPQLCDEFSKQDERIIVIHKKNGGLSDARNCGLKIATGEYILYVDSDDFLELDACDHLVSAITTGVDFVVGVIKEIKGEKISYQKHTNLISGKEYLAREYIIKSIENNEWYAPAVLNLYRRNFLLDNNLLYRVGYYFEDIEMLPRLCLAANKIVYVDYPFYNYVIRNDSIMTSGYTDLKKEMAIDNYNKWMESFSTLKDTTLQRNLYGILVRYYLTTARKMHIEGWKIKEMDFVFAKKYALNWHEKMKVIIFNYFPKIYNKI